MRWDIGKPIPLPPDLVEKKGVKMTDNRSAGMPGPLSVIVIRGFPDGPVQPQPSQCHVPVLPQPAGRSGLD